MPADTKHYLYKVRIPWKNGDTPTGWNEVCATAVEQYGLPGSKYTTHPTSDYMDFYFKNEQDAVWFNLQNL